MENLVFTQLSISEIRQLFRQELEIFFAENKMNNNSSDDDDLLTIEQAAAIIKITVPTIYGLVQKAKIPVCKKGKRLYFSKKELNDWIKTGRKKTVVEIENETKAFLQKSKKGKL